MENYTLQEINQTPLETSGGVKYLAVLNYENGGVVVVRHIFTPDKDATLADVLELAGIEP